MLARRVTSEDLGRILENREIEGLIECCKRLKQKKGMLLTEGQEEQIVREGINIAVLPVWKWLLRSESKK
ncbi:MAG: hypothetical protein J7L42_05000 [Elusimicrobia bacterium]|nr:hypothetical protein [Elusimicrobiota bacterium]